MASPRFSFVRVALEGCLGATAAVRLGLRAWWRGVLCAGPWLREPRLPAWEERAGRTPQPMSAFLELQGLIVHEPWLADRSVRVKRVWEEIGFGGVGYAYYLASNGIGQTLGLLMREGEPCYLRLYAKSSLAAIDGTLWAREIHEPPVEPACAVGGIDHRRHRTWSVRVVARPCRYELQITTGGLIPWTRDYKQVEDALLDAEVWLTDGAYREDADGCEIRLRHVM